MDANFGLVRKQHSGKSPLPLSVVSNFFLDSSQVDDFVTTYTNDKQKDRVCFLVTFFGKCVFFCSISFQ